MRQTGKIITNGVCQTLLRDAVARNRITLFTTASITDSLQIFTKNLNEKYCKILVMAGAGLSTPSGIPDFRSPGSGLYDNLEKYKLPYPEAIFDLNYFAMDPRPFMSLARELYPGIRYRPNLGHYFVRLLHKKQKLLRMYTQNIDGLERVSGLPAEKLVEAHGSFSTASCILCQHKHNPDKVRELILREEVMRCEQANCKGLVKPGIVFFGERLPDNFWQYESDALETDCLMVIGTSLEVYPFASIADAVESHIPRLLLNRDVVGSFGLRKNDYILACNIVDGIKKLVSAVGWEKELENIYHQCEGSLN